MRVGTDIRLQRPIDGKEDNLEAQLHVLEKKIEEVGNVLNENEAGAIDGYDPSTDTPTSDNENRLFRRQVVAAADELWWCRRDAAGALEFVKIL